MSEELKPCPFCGGDGAFIQIALSEAWMSCDRCSASSRMTSGPISATNAWNTRAESDEIAALKKELEIARGARKWIKCGERMPEYNNAVIVCCSVTDDGDGPFVASGFLDRKSQKWYSQDSFEGSTPMPWPVTHWQTLPEWPKS